MKTKVTTKEEQEVSTSKNEDRKEITLTVFAIFFIITIGMLFLTKARIIFLRWPIVSLVRCSWSGFAHTHPDPHGVCAGHLGIHACLHQRPRQALHLLRDHHFRQSMYPEFRADLLMYRHKRMSRYGMPSRITSSPSGVLTDTQ